MNQIFKDFISLLIKENSGSPKNIEFKFFEQSLDTKDRLQDKGFIVSRIEAYINSEFVGYINMSYIPREWFNKIYKEDYPFTFANKINGFGGLKPERFSKFSLPEQVEQLILSLGGWINSKSLDDLSENQLLEKKNELIEKLKQRLEKDFKSFENFHVNKPLVDYIRVDEKFRRQGIGNALYQEAAKWLAKKGLKLYASGIQSKEAEEAWNKMRNIYSKNIGQEKDDFINRERTFLSYLE